MFTSLDEQPNLFEETIGETKTDVRKIVASIGLGIAVYSFIFGTISLLFNFEVIAS